MPFGVWTRVGPKNNLYVGGPDPRGGRAFGVTSSAAIVKCREYPLSAKVVR